MIQFILSTPIERDDILKLIKDNFSQKDFIEIFYALFEYYTVAEEDAMDFLEKHITHAIKCCRENNEQKI